MTRQQIRVFGQDLLGELLGMPGSDNPFAWDRLISTAADDVAFATDCFAASAGFDAVANQASYPAPSPSIYRQTGAFWTDSSLNKVELIPISPDELDTRRPGWRTDPTGSPRFLVVLGAGRFVLYPTPDTSSLVNAYTDLVVQTNTFQVASVARPFVAGDVGYTLRVSAAADSGFTPGPYRVVSVAGGIATLDRPVGTAATSSGTAALSTGGVLLEGYGLPGSTWPAAGDECPLPDYAHMSVAYRAAQLRTMQRPTQENMARRQMLQDEYARAKGKVERTVVEMTEATRNADWQRQTSGYRWGGW